MQKLYAWLRPRHYYIDSGSVRRFNGRGLLNMAIVLSMVGVSFMMARGFSRPAMTTARSSQVVVVGAPVEQPVEAADQPQSLLPVSKYVDAGTVLQQWLQAHKSNQWGVVLQDLNNAHNVVSFNENGQFDSASMYKLFVTIPLAQKLSFAAWQTQHTLSGQGDHSYADCVQAMLALSDNPCGEAIGDYLGWSNITRTVHNNGFSSTTMSNSPIKTTAADVAGYLAGLEQGKWFDGPTRNFILDSLAHQKFRAGIPAGCGDCTVLNKTGQLNGVTHDAAIVTSGQQHYVLVIMSKGGSFAQIAELTKLINNTLH